MNTNLLDTTLEMARSTRLPVTGTCEATGVTPRWYYMFVRGEIKDPSVRRVQRLHDYLLANAQAAAHDDQPTTKEADHEISHR
jgi:hypothetical protein